MLELMVAPGETLWDSLAKNNIQLARPCGGRGVCGGCKVFVDGVGDVMACRFDKPGKYQVRIGGTSDFEVVMESAEITSAPGTDSAHNGSLPDSGAKPVSVGTSSDSMPVVRIAVDIGTTTVALSGVCGNRKVQDGFINPQRSFGADVVSRIAAANAGQGSEMCAMLMEPLMEALERMRARLDRDSKRCMVMIAGNTTMLHILRGFSCEGLGSAPFSPVDLTAGHDVWNGMRAQFDIYYMPGISTYVGADIVSGIYGLEMAEKNDVTLLLDLGTNGEMAVGNRSRMLCASAAAGPAFEGSPLALQIHASGILKCLHKLRKCGIIDEYGLLDDEYFDTGYPVAELLGSDFGNHRLRHEVKDEGPIRCRDSVEEDGILCITQDDIREIQMAKGAIRAGIEILLKEYGVSAAEVSRVYLAGGMGYYLNPDDAIGIGLLPAEFADKTLAVGNSCLTGMLKAAGGRDEQKWLSEVSNIADMTREIILAEHPDFAELYIEEMNLQ